MDRNGWIVVGIILLFYFAQAVSISYRTSFSGDELLTYVQAHLPTIGDLWRTLTHYPVVVDSPLPPLLAFFLLRTPMSPELALRLPSLIGYGAFVLSIYIALRKTRLPQAVALAAFAMAVILPGRQYAWNARSYALLLGLAGWALIAWQKVSSTRERRAWALASLWLLLGCAFLAHYFAVFLLLPFVAGEFARFQRDKRPDWSVWLTIAAAFLVVFAYLPLWRAAAIYKDQPWHGIEAADLPATYLLAFDGPLLIALLALVALRTTNVLRKNDLKLTDIVSSHEGIAWSVFTAIPIVAFAFAALETHSYVPRYGLVFVIGAVPLLALALWILAAGSARIMTGIAALLLLFFLYSAVAQLRRSREKADSIDQTVIAQLERFGELPIAIPDWYPGVRLVLFGPHVMHDRFVMIRSSNRALVALSLALQIPSPDYAQFMRAHHEFLMINSSWMLQRVTADGGSASYLGNMEGDGIYLVRAAEITGSGKSP